MTPNASCLYRLVVQVALGTLAATGMASAQHYEMTKLVSNIDGQAANTDHNLVNSWGIARSSTSPWWVADNATGLATLYDANGTPQSLIVTVPGAPTGTVFNGSPDFELAPGKPARFLFASEDGTISGWNRDVDPTNAKVVVTTKDAVYKGLTIASFNGKRYLYAADFHGGRVDVFDTAFKRVNLPDGGEDRDGPDMRRRTSGLSPFNVQNIGENLFVAFARPDAKGEDDVPGPGNGAIAVFTPGGRRIQVFQRVDALNSPWGMALAPSDFGAFSHHLIVGQFGGGEVLAFNLVTGRFAGRLLATDGSPIHIDGVWALGFGGGNASSGPANTLFFAAGPDDEKNGLFGTLTAVAAEQIQGNGN